MRHGIKRGVMAASALLLCLLAGCKGGEAALKAPEAYVLGEDSALPLNEVMEDEEGTLISIEEPSEEDEQRYTYRYESVSKPAALAGRYLERMTDQEEGFVLSDEKHRTLSGQPELVDEQGSVILARASAKKGQVFQIAMDWEEDVFTVQVSEVEGEILPREEEVVNPFVLIDHLDYLYSLPPERLGLEGSSMKKYRIYPAEGVVLVNKEVCRQFNVYSVSAPEQTNTIQGTYFLSTDQRHIYRLDEATGATISLY